MTGENPDPDAPVVTLTAEQSGQLRYGVTLGLAAMLHYAARYGHEPETNRPARARDVLEVQGYVDAVLVQALGVGLAPFETVQPAVDMVMVTHARLDAEAPAAAHSPTTN
jgi:hypothetical protein